MTQGIMAGIVKLANMKKEIRIVNDKTGTVQVTTSDERWYSEQVVDPKTKLPIGVEWLPSITFICSAYPKGIAFMQWMAKHGWDEAEAIKVEAGDRGTIVHHAIELAMNQGSIKMNDQIMDREGQMREMTPEEWYHVITFFQWHESVGSPKPIAVELTVKSKKHGYAGTLDYIFNIGGKNVLLDVKTSKNTWITHDMQVSALKQAVHESTDMKIDALAILQTGYTLNKLKHYKFTEVEDRFPLFLSTKEIWAQEHSGEKPFQRDYPVEIKVNNPVENAPIEVPTDK